MTEKAILSAIILTLIYLVFAAIIIILVKKWRNNSEMEDLICICLVCFSVATAEMVVYDACIVTIVNIIILLFTYYMHKGDKRSRNVILFFYGVGYFAGGVFLIVDHEKSVNVAEQYIETEITNIVYGENIKVKELPQDTMCLERIVLNDYSKNEDFYRYYYRIKEKDGKIESRSNGEIPKNNVEIHYVTDKEKAMFKKVVTETYYEKMFFEIEIPILRKNVETKYEFYIPRELLEVVEIK